MIIIYTQTKNNINFVFPESSTHREIKRNVYYGNSSSSTDISNYSLPFLTGKSYFGFSFSLSIYIVSEIRVPFS